MVLTPEQARSPEQREKNRLRQRRHKAAKVPGARVQEAMNRFIELIEGGYSRAEAIAQIDRSPATLEDWLKRFPEFKVRLTQAEIRRQRAHDPDYLPFDACFRERFFRFATPAHMQEILDAINGLSSEARKDKEPKALLVLAPPDHAKSSVIEDFLSWRIATDPNVRCLLISKTLGAAKKRTGRIQRRLTDRAMFEEFVDHYGPFKSEVRADARPWTSEYFTVIGQNSGERDYTLQALGIGGQIYGTRSEVIVLDDIADLSNQTPAEIEKQFEYIQVEVRSRLVEDGVLICIGTHMREKDIYTRLEELGLFDQVLKFPALSYDDEGKASALWPARYPVKRLENIKSKTDPRIWELVYQQNPLPEVGAVFTMDMIDGCWDDQRFIGHIPEGTTIVAGVDPSVRNYTAGVVFAVAPSGMRYLVDVWNEKGLTGEGGDLHAGVVEFIVELCRRYRVSTLCVEDGTWMSLINNSLSLKRQLFELNVRHIGVKVGPASGTSEEEAIRQLSGLFNHRMISLPGSPSSKQYLAKMIEQFVTWTPDKQHWRKAFDILKAFRQAEYAARHLAKPGKSHIPSNYGSETSAFLEEVFVA